MKSATVLALSSAVALVYSPCRAACVANVHSGVAIRDKPQSSAGIKHTIPQGSCQVTVSAPDCKEGWCPVYHAGNFGWVRASVLSNVRNGQNADFGFYLLKAIYQTVTARSDRGYNLRQSYSQDLDYGDRKSVIKRFYYSDGFKYPGGTGETMCVAAVAEVLIEGLNHYSSANADPSVFTRISLDQWTGGSKVGDLRSHIWEYEEVKSKGAAHALERFNVGKQTDFSQLIPGDLLKINRTSGPGHSTVFIGYVDAKGRRLEMWSKAAVGMTYFSAQEKKGKDLKGKPSNGLGFRTEYFAGFCPDYGTRQSNHCHVYNAESAYKPNVGYMLHPSAWGVYGSNLRKELGRRAYVARTGQPMPGDYDTFVANADGQVRSEITADVDREIGKIIDPSQDLNFGN